MANILEGDLYAGLSGCELEFDELSLGDGVCLSKTYAHLMAPYMMAFKPAPPGSHHPAPWKAASGGMGFDITAQLHMSASLVPVRWGDRFSLVRWIAALLRLWATPAITIPVISNTSFSAAAEAPGDQVHLIPYETAPRGIQIQSPEGPTLTIERLAWVRDHWQGGTSLVNEHREFRVALEALDMAHFVRDSALALVSIWAALEGMFSPAKTELRFRVSALIASFLEPPGATRRALHKRLTKLYDARSSAAHGKGKVDTKILVESMELLRQVLIKMISESHVPSGDELEARLFGELHSDG